MKKIIISILAITMCSSLSFGKSKIEGKKKLINSIPKKLIITKKKYSGRLSKGNTRNSQ